MIVKLDDAVIYGRGRVDFNIRHLNFALSKVGICNLFPLELSQFCLMCGKSLLSLMLCRTVTAIEEQKDNKHQNGNVAFAFICAIELNAFCSSIPGMVSIAFMIGFVIGFPLFMH